MASRQVQSASGVILAILQQLVAQTSLPPTLLFEGTGILGYLKQVISDKAPPTEDFGFDSGGQVETNSKGWTLSHIQRVSKDIAAEQDSSTMLSQDMSMRSSQNGTNSAEQPAIRNKQRDQMALDDLKLDDALAR